MTTKPKTRTLTGIAAAGAVALLLGGAILFPQVTQAQDAAATATEQAAPAAPTGKGATAQPGRGGAWGADQGAALAEALGITTDELQAAYEKAGQAALDQAVADGLITQAQADAMAARGLGGGFHFGGRGMGMGDVDEQALLADALGITADELQAAQAKAEAAQLAAAVEAGTLTQEQADALQAERDLRDYVAPRVQQALEDAVAAAVDEGIVTQEQADAFLQGGLRGFGHGFGAEMFGGRGGPGMDGFGMGGGRGGHGGRGGEGMFGGHGGMMLPGQSGTTPNVAPDLTPNATPDSSTGGQGG